MRKAIATLTIVAGLAGAYALHAETAARTAQRPEEKPPATSQAIRKAAARNPLDALAQAQSHAAVAYRAALARDGKATARQLAEVEADLEAARPAVTRLDRALGAEAEAIRRQAEKLRKRAGTDTGALVPEIGKVFKSAKQLAATVEAYMAPSEDPAGAPPAPKPDRASREP